MKIEKHLRKPFREAPLAVIFSVSPRLPINILVYYNLSKADKSLVQNNTSKLFTLLGGEFFFFNYSDFVFTSLSNAYS